MTVKKLFQSIKIILLGILVFMLIRIIVSPDHYSTIDIAMDASFYLSIAGILFVILYHFIVDKQRFSSINLVMLLWFFFMKFLRPYHLFYEGKNVTQSGLLLILIIISIAILLAYILSTIKDTFGAFKEVRIKPYSLIALSFAGIILVGSVLLILPVSRNVGQPPLAITDALFTATSSVCVTGLIVVDTPSYFSLFGQIVILSLIQIGALGIMTFAGFFWVILGEKMSLYGKFTTQNAVNEINSHDTRHYITSIVVTTFIIELIGAILLFIRFSSMYPIGKSVYYSIFHSISAFCNAGFALFSDSLMQFQGDTLVNLTISALIILGGIGFSVIINISRLMKKKRDSLFNLNSMSPKKAPTYKYAVLKLHTKMVLTMTFVLIVAGTIVFFLLERSNLLSGLSIKNSILSSFFSSVTTRTAGFNTLDFSNARGATLIFMSVMMFIGASPGSTGGGIKTTTFMVVVLTIINTLRERADVRVFNRELPIALIRRSLVLFFLSFGWVILITIVIGSIEQIPISKIIFESVSAFATVGLSAGVTDKLSDISKWLITLTMFMGRVGPLTLVLSLAGKRKKIEISRPEEDILIG